MFLKKYLFLFCWSFLLSYNFLCWNIVCYCLLKSFVKCNFVYFLTRSFFMSVCMAHFTTFVFSLYCWCQSLEDSTKCLIHLAEFCFKFCTSFVCTRTSIIKARLRISLFKASVSSITTVATVIATVSFAFETVTTEYWLFARWSG